MTAQFNVLRGAMAVRAEAPNDMANIIADLNKGFEDFKATNEERIKGINAKFDDVVTNEKLARIEASLSALTESHEQLSAKAEASTLGGSQSISPKHTEYAANFDSWFRTGEGEDLVKAENRGTGIYAAAQVGVDSDGGYTAPVEWDRTITDQLKEVGQMRRYASSQMVSGRGSRKLYNTHGTTSGWVGEVSERTETNTSVLKPYEFKFGEIYAIPSATEQILEDSEINIAGWIASEVRLEFEHQEGLAFVNGDGANKPTGLLTYDAAGEAARAASDRHPLGPISETATSTAAKLAPDDLITLIYDQPDERSQGAEFFAARQTIAEIRKMKDGDGRYLWQPPFQAGQPAQVVGHNIRELDGMGSHNTTGDIAVAFGNMEQTYRIFDRLGITVLRDPYSVKPFVQFYTRKRVGGGLWNPEFMRFLRVA